MPVRSPALSSHRAAQVLLLLGVACGATAQTVTPAAPAPAEAPATPEAPVTPARPDAPAAAPALERVDITGSASETAIRRDATAAKTVIGRDEITRLGDSSLTEVLKRLPGITLGGGRPGRGGDVRMRGLGGGYTQILVNGERVGPGFSLDTLTPEQVERIEILRSPTAETGAQAVAGTINIVLREDVRKRLNNVQLTVTHEDGGLQPNLGWTRADQLGDFSYSVGGHVNVSDRRSTSRTRTTETTLAPDGTETPTLDQFEDDTSQDRRRSVSLNGRLQWKLAGQDTLSLTPFLLTSRSQGHAEGPRTLLSGSSANDFDRSTGDSEGRYDVARVNGVWQTRLANRARLEIRAGVNTLEYRSDSLRQEFQGSTTSRQIDDRSLARQSGASQGGKYSQALDDAHQFSAGWEFDHTQRTETRTTLQTAGGVTTALQDDTSTDVQARSLRSAFWAQDEWAVSPNWALQGGLRWEGIATRSGTGADRVRNDTSVWSPLLHALWRPVEGGKDQVRASLTRSYRPPSLYNMVARRTVSNRYPVSGANEPTSPDRIGNPGLQPELATGLDLAYEHYLSGGGLVSIGVFQRRIHNLIRSVTTLQSVDWSPEPRWVSQPQNVGKAVTRGIELEAKFRLAEVMDTAQALDLRSNLSLFRSRVDSVPGPDNRLEQQPGWTANLGADYRVPGWPLTVGGSLNYTPGYALQESAIQRSDIDVKRVIDAYALWTFNPTLQLRVSAANLVARDTVSRNTLTTTDSAGTVRQTATTTSPSATSVSVKLELKL
jgi:outer membrane receptor for ferrienterochelin and colicins